MLEAANSRNRLSLLVIGPRISRVSIGEAYSAYKRIEALSELADLTLFTSHCDRNPVKEKDFPFAKKVVSWKEPSASSILGRLDERVKPTWPFFYYKVRQWLKDQRKRGVTFHIAHQITPQGARYPTPLRGLGFPYVIGPVGGGLPPPPPLAGEISPLSLTRIAPIVDAFRSRFDPLLRKSFEEAAIVFGVAPYVADILAPFKVRDFRVLSERCNPNSKKPLPPKLSSQRMEGPITILHVGRVIRTKGLLDTIRAIALLKEYRNIHLISAGDGPNLEQCRKEAGRLGVADRVDFLGRIERSEVEELYRRADIFCFPSFREPMGGVLFEAMSWSLPIITTSYGGPDFILDDSSAIKIEPDEPMRFASKIAEALRRLITDVHLRMELGSCARARLASLETWRENAEWILTCYKEVLSKTVED